jgi:hypothetical protein
MNPLTLLTGLNTTKIVVYAIVIVSLIIGFILIRREIKKNKAKKDAQKVLDKVNNDIAKSNLSHPLSNYSLWAGDLKSALTGFVEDEEAVYNVIGKMKNRDDVMQLITAFGVVKEKTLTQWIAEYFNEEERGIVNRLLSDKNVNYQF